MRTSNDETDDIENPSAEDLAWAPLVSKQNLKLFLLFRALLRKPPDLEISGRRAKLKKQQS